MLSFSLSLFLPVLFLAFDVESVLQNSSCPLVLSKPVSWEQINGKWYIQAVTTDLEVAGNCATFTFAREHDKTHVSIKWIQDNVPSYYNGTSVEDSVENYELDDDQLIVKYADGEKGTYRFLELQKDEYAVMYSCTNIVAGNLSDFELWELTRSPIKGKKYFKFLKEFIERYRMTQAHFLIFNNSPSVCPNGGVVINPSTMIIATFVSFILCLKLFLVF